MPNSQSGVGLTLAGLSNLEVLARYAQDRANS